MIQCCNVDNSIYMLPESDVNDYYHYSLIDPMTSRKPGGCLSTELREIMESQVI